MEVHIINSKSYAPSHVFTSTSYVFAFILVLFTHTSFLELSTKAGRLSREYGDALAPLEG
jgi:hypothetical protein